jgi:hypothetical protein
MATNLLALPLAHLAIATGNNEDWIDSFKFVVASDVILDEDLPQLDLTGIDFEMEIRRSASDHEVLLSASTRTTGLRIGDPPNTGFLIIEIPVDKMRLRLAGEYVGDIVATDEANTRRCVDINLTIIEGCTK